MSKEEIQDVEGTPPTNEDPEPVWVKLEPYQNSQIDDINEDSDMILIVTEEPDLTTKEQKDRKNNIKRVKRKRKRTQTYPRKLNKFYCEHCDYRTPIYNTYKNHTVLHGPKYLLCEFCPFLTKHIPSLRGHIRTQHLNKKKETITKLFKCGECLYTTPNKRVFVRHRRIHTNYEKRRQREKMRQREVRRKRTKLTKLKEVEKKLTYKCDKCPYATYIKSAMIKHLASIHNEFVQGIFKCDHCKIVIIKQKLYERHIMKNRVKESIKCDYCDFTSLYRCEFRKHKNVHLKHDSNKTEVKSVHKQIIDNIELPILNSPHLKYNKSKQFIIDTKQVMDWKNVPVIVLPGEERQFECTKCEYKTTRKATLKHHFERHHTNGMARPYKCAYCDITTRTIDQMRLHARRSKTVKLLECNQCPFTTQIKCRLKMHKRSHNPYQCTLCNYGGSKLMLQAHYRSRHTLSLKCDSCDFVTTTKHKMALHQSIHVSVPTYQCKECDYNSVSRKLFYVHVRKHHLIRNDQTVHITVDKVEKLVIGTEEQ